MVQPPQKPRPMHLTERDKRILEAIHAFDGMLGAQQIKRLFFNSWRTTRERLSKLYQNGYIARPDRRQRAALPDMIYWLGEQGAEIVAGLHGLELSEFKWRKLPKWSLVEHDLAVNTFRLDVEQACAAAAGLELEEWIPQGEFWAYPDQVEYIDAQNKTARRRVRPDGFFVIRQWRAREAKGYRHRMLLEIDRATEDNPRFGREKARPGVAYLRSEAYERRFGDKSGRWLVVTTGARRLANLKRQTEIELGRDATVFYFTTFEQVAPENLLTAPIWQRGGQEAPTALFSP